MKARIKASVCLVLLVIALICMGSISAYAAQDVGSSAECLAVIEASSGRVLYGKNLHRKRPMASTTKIVTAITVLENCDDIDKTIAVPAKAVGVEGSSIYLQKDEKVKVRDLLYGLMLQSGNDCAEALAITTAGSIEAFAAMMNETAKKAGATESNFVTPHGLHDDNHYTTAYDLAILTAYAMKNPTFKEIVATKKHTMPWEGRDYNRILINKNKILNTFDGGDGVKTGFTKKAGRCLVSSATRDGMQIIAVTLNCGPMFEECSAFMEKAFREYKLEQVCAKGDAAGEIRVEGGKRESVAVGLGETFYYPLADGERQKIKLVLEPAASICAPITENKPAGKFKIYLENQLLFEGNLFTIEKVDELSVWDKLKNLIHDWNQ